MIPADGWAGPKTRVTWLNTLLNFFTWLRNSSTVWPLYYHSIITPPVFNLALAAL